VPSGALFTDTVYTAPGSRPISYITGLQGELNNRAGQSATTVALSNKVDKEGSISASESSANLLARVQTAVPSGALFTDTVFNRNADIPNGSLEIIQVGGLTAALNTFKNASDSDTLDAVLQNNIDALEETVDAIPTSQLLVNGSFLNQAQFSITNSIQQLNVGLGLWEWLVQPSWSDVQRDPERLRLARTGDLPLTPAVDSLCYFPMITGHSDLSPANLHLVQSDASATQGEWGVYEHVPPTLMKQGLPLAAEHWYLFPNRSVPNVQVSTRGVGWPVDSSASLLMEWQVWVPADCSTGILLSSDADVAESPPERILFINLDSATGELQFRWDDKTGNTYNRITEPNLIFANRVYSVAMQKSAGADVVRVYLDGQLRIVETVGAPLTTVDSVRIQAYRTGLPVLREFNVRSSPVLPEIPFGPGGVRYDIGDPQLRWNSYML
jgi:hypothetical protein